MDDFGKLCYILAFDAIHKFAHKKALKWPCGKFFLKDPQYCGHPQVVVIILN